MTIEFKAIEFETAHEAIQWTEADGHGGAVRGERQEHRRRPSRDRPLGGRRCRARVPLRPRDARRRAPHRDGAGETDERKTTPRRACLRRQVNAARPYYRKPAMKKNEVKNGGLYLAKVSDKLVTVRIDGANSHGGWNATNTATGKCIRIKSAQRLRGKAEGTAKAKASKAAATAKVDLPAQAEDGNDVIAIVDRRDKTEKADDVIAIVERGDRGRGPRSELTIEEAAKLEKVRAAKAKKAKAAGLPVASATQAGGEAKPKRVSALDAAVQVLAETGKPMRAKELIEAMAEQNLWKSPGGKTPHSTLYAAMLREERDKGDASRFRKVDRGQFAFNKGGK